jgi:hypothetical protein
MMLTKTSRFQHALETVEHLPEPQQEHLIEVLQHRLIESRRANLADSIRSAKAEHKAHQTKRGSLSDLLKDLRSCEG